MTEAFIEYTWLSTQRPWNTHEKTVFQMQNQLPLAFQGLDNKESYSGPVTLSLPEWRQYVARGYNTLLPGIVPGGTYSGTVYRGHVRQGGGGV
jgi:hypothetical protein